MDEEKVTKVYNFETTIDEEGNIVLPKDELIKIREKGFENVNVVVFGSINKAVTLKGIDIDLFQRIRDMQTLPDTVVLDFLSVKGTLSQSNFEERINY